MKRILTLSVAAAMLMGCNKSIDSFSLLADASTYKQNADFIPKKVDILWVIDNSGSMETSQNNLASNFQSFISRFQSTNSDFRMAVITSDAFLSQHYNDLNRSKIRDGVGSNHSGVFVMDKNTPNLNDVFLTNIKQGINGSGDERAFSSFEQALNNPLNSDFRRPDAFLSIIIVSDEDDFSHDDGTNGLNNYYFSEDYNDPKIFSIQHYVDYLKQNTAAAGAGQNFSVNIISILDTQCLNSLTDGFTGRKVATRYMALADATGGIKGSLCSNFGETLSIISDSIVELTAKFQLTREPLVETIKVIVNGVSVPQDADNGWTYEEATNSIVFHGSGVPPAGANIIIDFDPKGIKN